MFWPKEIWSEYTDDFHAFKQASPHPHLHSLFHHIHHGIPSITPVSVTTPTGIHILTLVPAPASTQGGP